MLARSLPPKTTVTRIGGHSFVFGLAVLVLVGLGSPVDAQSNGDKSAPDAGNGAAEQQSTESDSASSEAVEPESGSTDARTPVDYCREYIAAFARSSARKLYRALSGQGFDMKPIDLGGSIELKARTSEGSREMVTFDVLTQNDRLVAGFVDRAREYRRILIAAHTTDGPVVASQLWPVPTEVPSTNACRPVDSQIAVPPLTLGDLDIEPFKFWGLRIVWRLPRGYESDRKGPDALRDSLTEALKQPID